MRKGIIVELTRNKRLPKLVKILCKEQGYRNLGTKIIPGAFLLCNGGSFIGVTIAKQAQHCQVRNKRTGEYEEVVEFSEVSFIPVGDYDAIK